MAIAAPKPSGSIDFGRAIGFVTDDPEWLKKVLVGGVFALLCAILVGVPFVFGYVARVLRRVAAGETRPLPEWDDLGGFFGDGVRLFGVQLVYSLGASVVIGVPALMAVLVLAGLGAASGDAGEARGPLALLAVLGFVALYAVILVVALALAIYLPAALLRVAIRESFAEGFAAREIFFFIRANLGNYALSLVAYLVAAFVAQFGLLLCFVGIFPAMFWSYLVVAHALGQTVRLNPTSL